MFLLLFLVIGGVAPAKEKSRTWTDLKGRALEGRFVRQDEAAVWVVRTNGRQIQIRKETLSEPDQKYLENLANLPGQGERFDTNKIDAETWKLDPEGFRFDGLSYQSAMKTDHFIVVGEAGLRDKVLIAYAEAAERLWTDIASDLPILVDVFKEHRMLIVLADEDEQARRFADWHGKHAERARVSSVHHNLSSFTIASFSLGSDLAKSNGLLPRARLFRLDSKKAQNLRLTWTQRIHFLTSTLMASVLDPVRSNEGYSFSMLKLSYSYHREFVICGKIDSEITFGGAEGIEGFSNGRNWADPTRKLIARGRMPSLDTYLKQKGSEASARSLGFGHGLLSFIHHDSGRLAKFGKMVEVAVKDRKCPTSETFAKAMGYESVADFDSAWRRFMESDSFE